MSKINLGRLNRRLFTLLALLACLTLVTPSDTPTATAAPPSAYQLFGTVSNWGSALQNPVVYVYKWNGSSWAFHGYAFGDSCGNYTYDAGGPGEYELIVSGGYVLADSHCLGFYYKEAVSGTGGAGLTTASPAARADIYTWG